MGTGKFYTFSSIFILVLLGFLTYKILSPFLTPIAWAVVFSIVFYPVYAFLLRHIKIKPIASLITLLLILLIIIGPFASLGFVLISEIREVAVSMDTGALDSIKNILANPKIAGILEKIQSYLGIEDVATGDMIVENIKKIGKGLITRLSAGFVNIVYVMIDFMFMALSIYFLLKDGPDFLSKIRDYMPFAEEQKNRLASQVKDMVISTVYGGVVVALIQGVLGGMAFYFFDLKSPVLWGTAMSIMSFLPLLGTFSIWGPAAGFLLIQGSYMKGVGLLLYGVFVISMVDNVLKPIIISGRTKMPTLLIFFSVLGGIKLFGFIGFIMGPLVMALFISVFEIFRRIEGGTSA